MSQKVKWLSPAEKCDLCGVELRNYEHFYDAKTYQGPWGLLCPVCFDIHGIGLGTGKGQKYNYETKEKIEG